MSKSFLSHVFERSHKKIPVQGPVIWELGLECRLPNNSTEMMGGKIAVESELNVGTTFTVTISFELDSDYKEEDTLEEEIYRKSFGIDSTFGRRY